MKEFDQDVAVSVPQPLQTTARPEDLILAGIAKEIGDSLFALWFSADRCLEVVGQRVRVFAETEFEARRLQRGYTSTLRRIATAVLGQPPEIEFLVREDGTDELGGEAPGGMAASSHGPPTNDDRTGDSPSPMISALNTGASLSRAAVPGRVSFAAAVPSDSPPRRRFTLHDLVLGPENEFTRAAVMQILQNPGQISPVLICGGPGTGKTHLLEALTGELRTAKKMTNCIYVTAEQFTSAFVHALRGGGLPSFRRKYRDVNVLAIDDVQFFTNKRATIHELQYTIDHLLRHGKQLILASDRPPLELRELGSEILTRFGSGLVCPLHPPSESSREAIVARICRERQLNWPSEVYRLIASQATRDSRRLLGAVNRIHAMSTIRNSPVTENFVAGILELTTPTGHRMLTMSQVEQAAAEFLATSPRELRSATRVQKIVNARMIAMMLCRKATTAALSEIGDHFGGRSHSTVIAAIKRVEKMLEDNEPITLPIGRFPIRDVWDSLENKLRLS